MYLYCNVINVVDEVFFLYCNAINAMNEVCIYIAMPLML